MPNAYETLGVEREASDEEIRAAYRRLARIYHPDRYATTTEDVRLEAQHRMAELNAAFHAIRQGRGADWYIAPQPAPAPSGASEELRIERVRRETMFRRWEEAEKQARRRTAEARAEWLQGLTPDDADLDEPIDLEILEEAEEAQQHRQRVFAATEVWEERNKRVDAEARAEAARLREQAERLKEKEEAERTAWLQETGQKPGRVKKRRRGLFGKKG